jgi:hypothetical protein
MLTVLIASVTAWCHSTAYAETPVAEIRHVVIYAEDDAFCGWPANNGVWIWDGREILVGFTRGTYKVMKNTHNIDRSQQKSWLARSADGGETWTA